MSDLYLKNLTDHLISKNAHDVCRKWLPETHQALHHIKMSVWAEIQTMRPETLGKIMCAFEVGDVLASKQELFIDITFSGDCEQMLRELVAACLARVIMDRLDPDTPSRLPKYSRDHKAVAK